LDLQGLTDARTVEQIGHDTCERFVHKSKKRGGVVVRKFGERAWRAMEQSLHVTGYLRNRAG
jgi:hypothetical protein